MGRVRIGKFHLDAELMVDGHRQDGTWHDHTFVGWQIKEAFPLTLIVLIYVR